MRFYLKLEAFWGSNFTKCDDHLKELVPPYKEGTMPLFGGLVPHLWEPLPVWVTGLLTHFSTQLTGRRGGKVFI